MLVFLVALLIWTSGLLAGFFFAYWVSVMPGLRKGNDLAWVRTMQLINEVIPNPPFMAIFMGPVILAPISAWRLFAAGHTESGWWALAATLFAALTFGITAGRNVPMNVAMANDGAPTADADAAPTRARTEKPWVMWNTTRTVTSVLAFAASIMALAQMS